MLEVGVMNSSLSPTHLHGGTREPDRSLPEVTIKPNSLTCTWMARPPVAMRVSHRADHWQVAVQPFFTLQRRGP